MDTNLKEIFIRNKYLNLNNNIKYLIPDNSILVRRGSYKSLYLLRNTLKIQLKRQKGEVKNLATGYVAKITQKTIDKIIYPSKYIDVFRKDYIYNLNAALNLKELFEIAVYIDTLPPMKGKENNISELGYHHFVAPIIIFDKRCRALITVREKINSKILYIVSVEVISIDDLDSTSISLRALMDNVKIWNYNKNEYDIYSISDIVCNNYKDGLYSFDYDTFYIK